MRKIDKSKIRSKAYSEWFRKIREEKKKHKTCSKYKLDVVMSLLYCQKGVCAYTEMLLCAPELLEEKCWNTEQYIDRNVNVDIFGHLEHFDPHLKKEYYCEWENLFVIHEKINVLKNDEDITDLVDFKPDSEKYNPCEIFDYDLST